MSVSKNHPVETKPEKPRLIELKPSKLIYKRTKPETELKPKPTPEETDLARPETKPVPESLPRQRLKVKTTVVNHSELKLFLARKKTERESKLKPQRVSTFTPKEKPPSIPSISATLIPPNTSLQPSAPRATCDRSAVQTKLSTGHSTGLSTNSSGPDMQRAHRGIPDKSGLL